MAEPTEELQAIQMILMDELGVPDDAWEQLNGSGRPQIADPYLVVAESINLWPPIKLELLRRSIAGGRATEDQILAISQSLIRDDDSIDRFEASVQLANRVFDTLNNRTGVADPLGRLHLQDFELDEPIGNPGGSVDPDGQASLYGSLVQQLIDNIFTQLTLCNSDDLDPVTGLGMSVNSRVESFYEPDRFRDIIEPERWTICPYMNVFFRAMDPQQPSDMALHPNGAVGYRETLTETVDFSLGFAWPPAVMHTRLRVKVFDDTAEAAPSLRSSYAFDGSLDGKILEDGGWLVAKRASTSNVTSFEVLKEVRFASFEVSDAILCGIWSFLKLAMLTYCLN